MARIERTIVVPAWFRLRTIAKSHGWYDLPPFHWDDQSATLSTAALLAGRTCDVEITSPASGQLRIVGQTMGRASKGLAAAIEQATIAMLGLQHSFDDFYELAGDDYRWAMELGAGPFLRGASVFEDAVKMLATTNCSWSLTRQMMTRLVDALGSSAPSGRRAFPTPQAMASEPVEFYRTVVRAGYRASLFKRFSEQVTAGEVDVESWATFEGETSDLVQQIRSLAGFGPYSAENLCKLLGRFDGLGLDSWCLKKFPTIVGPVRGDVTRAIVRRYQRFGKWKGLALWLDLTRDWHSDPDDPASTSFKKR